MKNAGKIFLIVITNIGICITLFAATQFMTSWYKSKSPDITKNQPSNYLTDSTSYKPKEPNHEGNLDFSSAEENKSTWAIPESNSSESWEKNDLEKKLLYPTRPKKGEMVGTLEINSVSLKVPIYHGTDDDELDRGVGHYAGSVLPGEPDHCILSGHRDTVFRKLEDVKEKDLIVVNTSAGSFTYQIKKIYIVDQYDTSVITSTGDPSLSLTTCYPFQYVGNAPDRYILYSVLIDYELKT